MAALLTAAVAAAFNLVCSGTYVSFDSAKLFEPGAEKTPFDVTLRLDLKIERWCEGVCKETKPIALVGSRLIFLESGGVDADGQEDYSDSFTTINRETAEYSQRVRFRGKGLLWTGKCESKPFTGFPALKF